MGQNTSELKISTIDRSSYRLQIVYSLFNKKYTERLLEDSCAEFQACGISVSHIRVTAVPGALEIPFLVNIVSKREDCDGILALGCVVRGETYHFELVANESARGIREASCKKIFRVSMGFSLSRMRSRHMRGPLQKERVLLRHLFTWLI